MNRFLPLSLTSTRAKSRAFSLVELLVVIAVLAILAGIGVSVFQQRGVQSALHLGAGLVELARSEALSNRNGSRIFVDIDPTSDGFLRRFAILTKNEDGTWELHSRPVVIPNGVQFFHNNSSGFGAMTFDFQSSTAQTGTGAGTEGIFYEFDGNGRFVTSGGSGAPARMIFVNGILDNNNELVVPESRFAGRDGFVMRRAGHVTFYEDASQIPAPSL